MGDSPIRVGTSAEEATIHGGESWWNDVEAWNRESRRITRLLKKNLGDEDLLLKIDLMLRRSYEIT